MYNAHLSLFSHSCEFRLCDILYFYTLTRSMEHSQNLHYYKTYYTTESIPTWNLNPSFLCKSPWSSLGVWCETPCQETAKWPWQQTLSVYEWRLGLLHIVKIKELSTYQKSKQSKDRVCLCILSPLMVYAFMNRGVHWLFFSFLHAGGVLMSCSSMSHTNMSSGCTQTAMMLYNTVM